jgi:hypothetical protein
VPFGNLPNEMGGLSNNLQPALFFSVPAVPFGRLPNGTGWQPVLPNDKA